jgi:3'-phosphoadenosine 5'-phosphosulfate (PAPS) 3'-phosphatase
MVTSVIVTGLLMAFLAASPLVLASQGNTLAVPSYVQDQKIQTIKSSLPPEIENHELAEKLAVALQVGRQAGEAILAVKATRNLQVEIKTDNTPVTDADRTSNDIICQTINRLYPTDGILSEETIQGEKPLSSAIAIGVDAKWTWVIDPLDGTKAFIKSSAPNSLNLDPRYQGKHYGVHIGLLSEGEPVLGVNYYPEIDTLYFALDGFAYKQIGDASAARIITQPMSGIHPVLNPTTNERNVVGKIYQKLLGESKAAEFNDKGLFLDSFGYKMACIAEGNGCNLFIAPAGGPGFWDVCSMLPLVQAVGGKVTDWEGNPINFRDRSQSGLVPKGVIIAVNQDIHRKIVEIIAELVIQGEIPPYGQFFN